MNTIWQNSWVTDGKKHSSDLGWEVRRHNGQQFALYRGTVWHSVHSSIADAKDAADQAELEQRRAEWGTGGTDHVVTEGRGGIWDTTVALKLSEGRNTTSLARVRDIADNTPDTPDLPVICVSLELIHDGAYEYREYILLGSTKAKAQFATENKFDAVYLSWADAEIARVPDISDTAETRKVLKMMYQSCLKPDKPRTENPWRRSIGDPLDYVRKHMAG